MLIPNTVCTESYTVLDVAFSPSELRRSEQCRGGGGGGGELDPQVYLLALSFAQRQHGLSLSERYRIHSAGPRGSREDVQQRLECRKQPGSRPAPGGAHGPDAGGIITHQGFTNSLFLSCFISYPCFVLSVVLRGWAFPRLCIVRLDVGLHCFPNG